MHLLLAALRGRHPADHEWESVFALAGESLTIGTLAHRLLDGEQSEALSAEVTQFLDTIRQRVDERNRRADNQLAEAVSALGRAGLRPALIKGVALRVLRPEEARGRILSDLDLVLPGSARSSAVRALEEIGYAVREPLDDTTRPVVLCRPQDVGMIDLQFAFRASGVGYDYEDLARFCRPVTLGAGVALLPDASIQAALLVLHDQIKDQDYWRGLIDLRHLLDIEMLAAEIDWQRLSDQFPGPFAQAGLRTQLVALDRLLGAPVPSLYRSGWWPLLQHWRRMVQMRWPGLKAAFSYLTIAGDVVAGRLNLHRARFRPQKDGPAAVHPRTGGSGHLLRTKAVGKV